MPARRCLLLVVAFLLTGGIASAARSHGNYDGAARDIAPTAAQAGYTALTADAAAARPPAVKRHGYRNGWQVAYVKGTMTKPVAAFALIYVYETTADAMRAYAGSCSHCSGTYRTEGISMKFEATTQKSTLGVLDIATCRNIYVAVVVSGKTTARALATAAGALAGGVYARAMAGGMSPCKSA